MKKTIILLLSVMLAAPACNFLDTHPKDGIGSSTMWTTPEHIQLGVTSTYSVLKNTGSYCRNVLCDAYTKYAFLMNTGFDDLGQRYFCYNTATTGYGVFSYKWTHDYLGVQYANLAIENIPNVQANEDVKNRALAEVKFLRALYYFDLLTYYSGHKTIDKGIPLYTKMPSSEDAYLPRSNPAQVRHLMIEDLTFAAGVLDFTSYEKGRANAAAALALLGKVYLFAEQWDKAAETFAELIQRNKMEGAPYSLEANYAKMFTLEGENNTEYVFVIDNLDTYGNGSYIDLLYNNRSANCSGTNTSIPTIFLVDSYQNKDGSDFSWSAYPTFSWSSESAVNAMFSNRDPRLEATIIRPYALQVGKDNVTYQYRTSYDTNTASYPCIKADNGFNDHYMWRKFTTTGNQTTIRRHSPIDTPLIRWADVLLMYAEALNESDGPTQEMYNAINAVRNRAGMPNVKTSSQSQMRERIRNERLWELAGEGHLFPDWQRWYAHDPNFDYESMCHEIYGYAGAPIKAKAGTRNFTPRNWCYAIPKTDIEINPALEQAAGWND